MNGRRVDAKPTDILIENVAAFETSQAHRLLMETLAKQGYGVKVTTSC